MTFLCLLFCFTFIGASFGCGVPAIDTLRRGSARIIHGKNALPGAWPWQVSLQGITGYLRCGGSLISKNWVVTAAHCKVRPSDRVVAGMTVRRSGVEDVQVLKIAQIFRNPSFSVIDGSNDIALLKLATPANFSQTVSPVCLPQTNDHFPGGTQCVITGWGNTRRHGLNAIRLQQTTLPLLSQAECRRRWGSKITDVMVCAGGNGITVCKGDSGGPLVCQKDGAWTLVGVVSWTSENCATYMPTVCTRVTKFMPWIQEIMANN